MPDPSKWSNRALSNWQRARSSPVTITRGDGTSETVSTWEMAQRRKAALRDRAKKKKRNNRAASQQREGG